MLRSPSLISCWFVAFESAAMEPRPINALIMTTVSVSLVTMEKYAGIMFCDMSRSVFEWLPARKHVRT